MLLAMQVLKTPRRIPLRNLLQIMEYPADMQDTLHLYAEGYVLVELLIQNGGRGRFLQFLNAANRDGWDRALQAYYGHRGIDVLEQNWNQWVLAGCPAKQAPEGTMVAAAETPIPKIANNGNNTRQASQPLARSQAPDRESVSVEDQADGEGLGEVTQVPKLGQGLQAPAPARRGNEPAMLSRVNLGSESEFNQRQVQPAVFESAEQQIPKRAPRVTAQLDYDENAAVEKPEQVIRPSRPKPQLPKSAGPSRPAPSNRSQLGNRSPVTPVLRLESRPNYGQAQPFPETSDTFVGDVAG
jgi:hypothetical protein